MTPRTALRSTYESVTGTGRGVSTVVIVLREMSPLDVDDSSYYDTTLAHLRAVVYAQIVFDWSGERVHTFHLHRQGLWEQTGLTPDTSAERMRLRWGALVSNL